MLVAPKLAVSMLNCMRTVLLNGFSDNGIGGRVPDGLSVLFREESAMTPVNT